MKTPLSIVLALTFSVLTVQAQHPYADAPAISKTAASLGSVPADVKKQMNAVLLAYFDVKNALVATDGKVASDKATKLVMAIKAVEARKLTAPQQKAYAKLGKDLLDDAEQVAETRDTGHQRDHFSDLSKNVYVLVRTFGVNEAPTYYDYCPMAFNNQGGYWLSEQKPIANPYFGSKMMRCGSVKETL